MVTSSEISLRVSSAVSGRNILGMVMMVMDDKMTTNLRISLMKRFSMLMVISTVLAGVFMVTLFCRIWSMHAESEFLKNMYLKYILLLPKDYTYF